MSDGINATGADGARSTSSGASGIVDSVKHEAADLKATTADAAKDVAGTAKSEIASVSREAKTQAQDLFHQTRRELSDQAATQQERIAAGLGALGDELGSMARNSDGSGIAADLVQQVSDRASSAASWLESRDPAGVLEGVKVFARRRPVMFIGAALIAGIAAGRLTRALMANAGDEADAAAARSDANDGVPAVSAPRPPVTSSVPSAGDAPLYAESAARFDGMGAGASRERSDTL